MNKKTKNKVLIIGCGWTGLKLGQFLNKEGYEVTGTTRDVSRFKELEEHGIQPYQLELNTNEETQVEIPQSDHIVISISPGGRGGSPQYPKLMMKLSELLTDRNDQIIMYSSTSVYENHKNTITESDLDPTTDTDNYILKAEGALRKQRPDSVILRLCGLYAQDRHPVKYMAGRNNIKNGDAPVNLVHRDDVVNISALIISKGIRGEVYNICSDEHPSREELYTHLSEKAGLEKPVFDRGGEDSKCIDNQKIKEKLSYRFKHPDPVQIDNLEF